MVCSELTMPSQLQEWSIWVLTLGGSVDTPIRFVIMSLRNVVINSLASKTPFRLPLVYTLSEELMLGQVQWIGFCHGFSSITYWFGYGSLRISPLLLQASSEMHKIDIPAMLADAVPKGTTSQHCHTLNRSSVASSSFFYCSSSFALVRCLMRALQNAQVIKGIGMWT